LKSKPFENIVIIGANVAGLSLCKQLSLRGIKATVIDPNPYFEWLPNMHEIISKEKAEVSLSFDKRIHLQKMQHTYINSAMYKLDHEGKCITLENNRVLYYDKLVIATGGVNKNLGVDNVERYAFTFKSLKDAMRIRDKYQALLERKSIETQDEIVIVGAGVEGVEILGELLKLKPAENNINITVVNNNKKLFMNNGELIHNRIIKKSKDKVRFIHGSKVNELNEGCVALENGIKIKSPLIIWTGGVAPSENLYEWGLTENVNEWIPVNKNLAHKNITGLYAIGDCVNVDGYSSKQAYIAMEMADLLAENIYLSSVGRATKNFKPSSKPMLVTFGNLDAYLISDTHCIASSALLPMKEIIFQMVMLDMERSIGHQALMNSFFRLKPLLTLKMLKKTFKSNVNAMFSSAISFK